jgi:hypothetical protein
VLVIIDEACGVPEQLWIAGDALTTNANCRMVAIGNPDNPASHFRKVCTPGGGWHVIGISRLRLAQPDRRGGARRGGRRPGRPKEWVEEKRREWGEDNPLYRSKVLGEFSPDAPYQVVRTSDMAVCRIDRETPYAPADLLPVELGVDVGGGRDETVVRERRGRRAGQEWRAHTDRPELIAPMVLQAIKETGATSVKVDSIGIGFGVIGELRNMASQGLHRARIDAVNVAEKASQPDKFINLRAEIWWEIGRGLSEQQARDGQGWDLSAWPTPTRRWRSCWSRSGRWTRRVGSRLSRRRTSSPGSAGRRTTPTRCCWRSTAAVPDRAFGGSAECSSQARVALRCVDIEMMRQ